MPTTWLVRTTANGGSDTNGGTSTAILATDTDGVTAAGSATFTSVAAKFLQSHVGHGIYISKAAVRRTIASVESATSCTLNATIAGLNTGCTWTIGGAMATIGTALGAQGIKSGDTLYIGAGTYREAVTVGMTSATATTSVIGDVDGAHTGDAGEVRWTAYATNDTTAPVGAQTLSIGAHPYLAFSKLVFVGGTTYTILGDAAALNCSLTDCAFIHTGSNDAIRWAVPAAASLGLTIDRCFMLVATTGNFAQINLIAPTTASGAADYDIGVTIRSCVMIGSSTGITFSGTGALAFKPGGGLVQNCTLFGTTVAAVQTVTTWSTATPALIYNNLIANSNAIALQAHASGELVEDHNLIYAKTPRTLVSTGANSFSDNSHALLVAFGQASVWGGMLRPFLMPLSGSPLLGFGAQAGAPAVDALNRPRPSGGASTAYAVGAYERHDCGTQETTGANVDGGTGSALKLTGPADHDIPVSVDAAATTITVRVAWDANHADTNKPQATLLANGQIGVAAQTVVAAGTAGAGYETLVFTPFTPTAKGWVTLRLQSRSAAATGIAWFDTLGVT